MALLLTDPGIESATVVNASGTILASSERALAGLHISDTRLAASSDVIGDAGHTGSPLMRPGKTPETLVSVTPFTTGLNLGKQRSHEAGALVLEYDMRVPLAREQRGGIQRALTLGLTSLLLPLGVWLFLDRTVAQKVVRLSRTVSLLASGDFSARTTVTSSDELGVLADSVNRMADRVEDDLQTRAHLAALSNHVECALLLVALDASGAVTVISVNDFAIRAFGLPVEKVMGQSLDALVSKDRAARVIAMVREAARKRQAVHWDSVIQQGDEPRIFDSTASPIMGPSGAVTQVAVISMDVTARRTSDVMVQELPDAVLLVTSTGQITRVNRRAEALFGYTRDELIGQPVQMLVPESLRTRHEGLMGHYLASPASQPMAHGRHLMARRKDGTSTAVSIMLTPITAGHGALVMVAISDVEEQDRLEAQLRQTQKLESLGQLAAGVAHDFNNLLTVINGYAASMREDIPNQPELDEPISAILTAGERAAGLTRQLLTFGRSEVQEVAPLAIDSAIFACHSFLRRLVREDVRIELALRSNGVILSNQNQVLQVLMNLIVNARDAMPGGGLIHIATTRLRVDDTNRADFSGLQPGPFVAITVRDSGHGIPLSHLPRIFEPFFTTKAERQGTGLGLSIVYGIIRQRGGDITVTSDLGQGSTFTLYWPESKGQVATPDLRPASLPVPVFGTALIVEDQPAVRVFMAGTLRRRGFKVLEAADGHEAIRMADAEGHLDLLVTDVVMPHMTGPALADQLTAVRANLRVVFVSGYAPTEVLDASRIPHLIQKPFTAEELLRKVDAVLSA